MRKLHNAPPDKPQTVDYGGYHRNAENLALLRTKAVMASIAALGLVVGGVYLAARQQDARWLIPFAVAAIAAAVYARSLWVYTTEVRYNLWRREIEAQQDIDGDGEIGQPRKPKTRYLNIAGELVPFEEEPNPGQPPVIDMVPGFDLTPADLADLVEYAGRVGLGRSKLVGITLPSGTRFSKSRWETWNTKAARRGWITPGGNGSGGSWAKQPASIVAAIRQAQRFATGLPDQSTGRAAPPPASDRFQTALERGRGAA